MAGETRVETVLDRLCSGRARVKTGDVFVIRPRPEVSSDCRFSYGRVIDANADWAGVPVLLLYLYRVRSMERLPVPDLPLQELAIAPALTNLLGFRRGYFEVVESRPVLSSERVAVHAFSNLNGRVYDERFRPLDPKTQTIGPYALDSFVTIGIKLSEAFGWDGTVPGGGPQDGEGGPEASPLEGGAEEAVLIRLGPHKAFAGAAAQAWDLDTLEEELVARLRAGSLGEYDGDETNLGTGETIVFLYGPDAEQLFAGLETFLRECPLTSSARIEIRRGPPGAPSRTVRL